MLTSMSCSASRINELILSQLAVGEKQVLSLVVAVRKALSRSEAAKGDLTAMVKSALRRLVASKEVIDVDGMYSLAPSPVTRE
ncbi:MAG: hypothetical protein H7Z14_12130 [Anaerolineae bacterium]|nr:hypothetical protein [Phycisphaerae bacterium]